MTTDQLKIELQGLREQFSELERWSLAAAQELQEFIDDAEEAGSENPLPGTRALLEEHNDIIKRFGL